MAKDFLGNIIVLGGVAVGGYFIWQWWQAQQVQAAALPSWLTGDIAGIPIWGWGLGALALLFVIPRGR